MRGGLRVGDTLELPELRLQKKVKSMQMFRRPVQACSRGDRLGICVTQLDAKLVERGLACTPGGGGAGRRRWAGQGRTEPVSLAAKFKAGDKLHSPPITPDFVSSLTWPFFSAWPPAGSVPTFEAAVAAVERIRFFADDVRSRSKMHVTVGHTTGEPGRHHNSGSAQQRLRACSRRTQLSFACTALLLRRPGNFQEAHPGLLLCAVRHVLPAAVMAELTFFGLPAGQGEQAEQAARSMQQRLAQLSLAQQQEGQEEGAAAAAAPAALAFDSSREYLYQEALYGLEGRPAGTESAALAAWQHPADQQQQPPPDSGQQQQEGGRGVHHGPQWVYLRFSQPVTAAADSLVIGSRLDADLHASTCRLAFYGRLCALADPAGEFWGSVAGAKGGCSSVAAVAAPQAAVAIV